MSTRPKIKWIALGLDKNDLIADYNNFTLRIERMRKGVWWYAIYENEKTLPANEIMSEMDARCSKEAKNKIYEHITKNIL